MSLFQITLLLIVIQFLYWLILSLKVAFHQRETPLPKPTSVVICAKNEAENLKELIPKLKLQTHPTFNITVGDDFSEDNTKHVLAEHQINRVVASKNIRGKKQILEDTVLAVKHPFILVTDADCRPSSSEWIKEMSPSFDNSIVLSYAPLFKSPKILNRFARFETLLSAIQYISFALFNRPYMGVGRNLLFPKALFEKIGGLQSHKNIVSGDDDLFIQEIANHARFEVSINPKAFMYSKAKKSVKEFIAQKKRHISTSKHYRLVDQVLLSLNPTLQIFIYGLFFVLIIKGFFSIFGIFLITKWLLLVLALCPASIKLKEQDLLFFIPLLDVLFLFYLIYFIPSAFFKDEKNWS